jgi:hypothetical protein
MRDKVTQIIETYAEGGTLCDAIDATNMRRGDFYSTLRKYPELKQKYYEVQESRADMMVDEAYSVSMDNDKHPGTARVQAEIRLKIAAAFDRKRFGEKVDMTIDQTISVGGALQAARARALQPRRNLAGVIDAEVTDIPQLSAPSTTDKKSDEPAFVPDPSVNPLDD